MIPGLLEVFDRFGSVEVLFAVPVQACRSSFLLLLCCSLSFWRFSFGFHLLLFLFCVIWFLLLELELRRFFIEVRLWQFLVFVIRCLNVLFFLLAGLALLVLAELKNLLVKKKNV